MRDSDPVDSLLLMRVGLYFGPACFFILTALWTKLLVEGVDRSVPADRPPRPAHGGAGAVRRAVSRDAPRRGRGAGAQGAEGGSARLTRYQRTAALAQVNPDPKAVRTSRSPRARRPAHSASSSAMGIDAAVVLPYF